MNTTGKLVVGPPTDEVMALDQAEFPHPWTKQQWQELDQTSCKLFSWIENDKLLGFALFGTPPFDDVAHLFKILILKEKRGSGASSEFWSNIKKELRDQGFKSVYLEVESSNARAFHFYQKSGFSLLRTNKAYYSNGDDALIMLLTL